ncbi:TauD/TfdA family dioxygenase [Candidatus Magnetaquicoccus inordinatus]|uniref:TauD/TfdA family dioxygenase n=1 Tax=Candidatus Magnetaquicoccus inordinatus TaxID=2496818 RepID=UPI00102AD18C|nr:TauD/TfdA family dioxygenase [Candidatus Magnetaquicoccus inordinatus]
MTTAFALDNEPLYQAWKRDKLAEYPSSLADLLVEIADPFALTDRERSALLARCAKSNMALFRLLHPEKVQSNPLPALTAQLGIHELDRNLGAGEDGLSALTPGGSAYDPFAAYIPYRAAAIGWHTDGYYNPADHQVQSLCLYCERPAHEGGENELLDHELVYMQLRDRNPQWIATLMEKDVMTIPARLDAQGEVARPERSGPVFSVNAEGTLHTRFTNRHKSIRWRSDSATTEALAAFRQVLQEPSPYLFRGRLQSGWGLISNNVLHTRNAFRDLPDAEGRILYRARFFDRLPSR